MWLRRPPVARHLLGLAEKVHRTRQVENPFHLVFRLAPWEWAPKEARRIKR